MTKDWTDHFKWESEAQEKGFGAFVKWLRALPDRTVYGNGYISRLNCTVAFFIQKDHESHIWWSETVADQVSRLEKQIALLQDRVKELEARG